MTVSRLVRIDDSPALAELLLANREFLAPTAPFRPEEFFTADGQRARAIELLNQYETGTLLPHVILDGEGNVTGQITLNEIVRGPFLSCRVGYWLAEGSNGRGLATAALGNIKRIAFEELGLHRIEAGTLLDNERSQRVLLRNGFERFGLAPRYLQIAGDWRDHVLFQTIND
jgi:[ribosomal protein S5]-alanine N-acetyltransferase